jgi:hypothetical protein
MIPLFVAYYNLVREHQALGNKTPVQAAGIDLKLGKDKWIGLIKKAHNNQQRRFNNQVILPSPTAITAFHQCQISSNTFPRNNLVGQKMNS